MEDLKVASQYSADLALWASLHKWVLESFFVGGPELTCKTESYLAWYLQRSNFSDFV